MAEKPGYTKTITKKGSGGTPSKGDTVSVKYTGTFTNGKVFDSNADSKTPLKFKVGTGQVIRGWDEGLLTMQKGEKAKLIIEPAWAYGKKGKGPIGPNETLHFDVELLDIDS